ncbi:MAG: PBSX family phage terminase large subunit [Lentilactobacillus buchneri]|jgi:phage terminase large subunit|nr:PBSX family phage terminase large subunit [Lentilactobacillus buchneri]MCI1950680.1 PBSX family phage terminase large subunit [Lentilactobacillus buchneri]MCI2018243.1 PBSX family phage terminase large subunit [Lentilactobacillus buchneri]MCI2027806.1 PBSX family phage terminase large subunit [Lentilactobacillus buchneri]
MTSVTKIKTSELIQPHFKTLWNTNASYIIARGGRGSFKSSTISMKLVMLMKKHTQMNHKVNIVCLRENATYLRDSVYDQISWALSMFNMTDEYVFRTSPLRIVHRRTRSAFYFYGVDDPFKLKSNTIGNVIALWYEEAANFKSPEVFDQTNPTFIRQKSKWVDYVPVYYSYNPPKNPYEWINEWVDDKRGDDDYFIDTSTYLDDKLGVTSPQQLKLIERYKENDYDYYRYLYLGEAVGLGTNVYNMNLFHPLEELPSDDPIQHIAYAVDAGHINSATTCLAGAITAKNNLILLNTYYYSPMNQSYKKAPSDLVPEVYKFIQKIDKQYQAPTIKRTIDSAEGALRNEFIKETGIRWHGVVKSDEADMIDFVSNLLAQGRVYYLDIPENQIFIQQHRQYQWDEKTIQSDKPKVIKENDHTCDAFKYMVMDNANTLGIKRGGFVQWM